MLLNKTVAVVIPAYNEEKQIGMVIETMPDFVDRIIIVNDCSNDRTEEVVKQYLSGKHNQSSINLSTLQKKVHSKYNYADKISEEQSELELQKLTPSVIINHNPNEDRIILISQKTNSGVGASVARGYKWCKDHSIDCIAKLDGDGQMDPDELESICMPVVAEDIDYVKGNRLIHRSAWLVIPKVRYLGNSILSILTKIASGYWHVSDTQTAFTAISLRALKGINLNEIYHSYGYPNDMLVKLNISMCTIREVGIKPVYNVGEKSKMRILKVIPRVSWLLLKSFFERLWVKYLFRDFHPLFLLYNFAFLLAIIDIPFFYKVVYYLASGSTVSFQSLIIFMSLFISSFQSLLFAMWMDIQDNDRLYK